MEALTLVLSLTQMLVSGISRFQVSVFRFQPPGYWRLASCNWSLADCLWVSQQQEA